MNVKSRRAAPLVWSCSTDGTGPMPKEDNVIKGGRGGRPRKARDNVRKDLRKGNIDVQDRERCRIAIRPDPQLPTSNPRNTGK